MLCTSCKQSFEVQRRIFQMSLNFSIFCETNTFLYQTISAQKSKKQPRYVLWLFENAGQIYKNALNIYIYIFVDLYVHTKIKKKVVETVFFVSFQFLLYGPVCMRRHSECIVRCCIFLYCKKPRAKEAEAKTLY